jgi:hypothetical protein
VGKFIAGKMTPDINGVWMKRLSGMLKLLREYSLNFKIKKPMDKDVDDGDINVKVKKLSDKKKRVAE